MTQAANQELLNQQTLFLPSESSVVNDIAGKKLREDLWKCAKQVKNYRSTDGIFPSYTVTEDWGKKKKTEDRKGKWLTLKSGVWILSSQFKMGMTDWTLAYLGETDKKENAFEWRLADIIKGL